MQGDEEEWMEGGRSEGGGVEGGGVGRRKIGLREKEVSEGVKD